MVLDEARVRALRRPEHRDSLERRARPGGIDDESSGLAYFLVGVGGGHDCDGAGWDLGPGVGDVDTVIAGSSTEGLEELTAIGVVGVVTSELADDANVEVLAQCSS